MRLKTNTQIGAVMLVVTLLLLVVFIPQHVPSTGEKMMSPRFFPTLTAGAIGVLSIILLVSSLLGFIPDEDVPRIEARHQRQIFGAIATAGSYVLFISWLGFLIPTIAALFTFMRVFGERNRYNLVLVPVVVSLFVFIVFGRFLYMRLPQGLLTPYVEFLIY